MNRLILFLMPLVLGCQKSAGQTEHFIKVAKELATPSGNHVLVVAHRADWRNAPENSLQAVQNCIDMGVDIVEIDVRVTADNQVVVIHDKTLERTTSGYGKVSHHTLKELQSMTLKNGYGLSTTHNIPSLEELLLLTKNKIHVFIDKGYYILPQVWEVVEKTGTQNQVLLEGKVDFSTFQKTYPEYVSKVKYMPRIKPETVNLRQYVDDFSSQMNVPLLIASFKTENRVFLEYLSDFKRQHIGTMGSTLWAESCAGHTDDVSVQEPEAGWGWMLRQGFTAICTDRPALLIDYLQEKELH